MQSPIPLLTLENVERALRRTFRDNTDAARVLVDSLETLGPRIQVAAIAASDGSLKGLEDAVTFARTDPRDLIALVEYGRQISKQFDAADQETRKWMIVSDWIDYCWKVGDASLKASDESSCLDRNPLLFPTLSTHKDARLSFSFETPILIGDKRVNWLHVRDWLITAFSVTFTSGFDSPTCEWLAQAQCAWQQRQRSCTLFYCDFPDELLLVAKSLGDNEFLLAVRQRLAEEQPDLGELAKMDARAWRVWLEKLESHSQ